MTHDHSTVAVFNTDAPAEAAIRRLFEAGFPIERLSIIGNGSQTEARLVGFFGMGDCVRLWGKHGALWGGLWGLLAAGVFMTVPLVGPVVVRGHLATMVSGALQGAAVVGGLGAVAEALASIGVPNDSVLRYEQDLRAENFLVVVHGSEAETRRAERLLTAGDASRVAIHTPQAAGAATAASPARPVANHRA